MDLSIIIINWNSWDYLENCLKSIEPALKNLNHEIIVIDNSSHENRLEALQKKFNHLPLRLISNSSNVGFAAACNQGIHLAKGSYLLFQNPDTEIRMPSFSNAFNFFKENPNAAFLGPRLLNEDGSLQRWTAGSFPSIESAFGHYFFVSRFFGSIKTLFIGKEPTTPMQVDWVCGAFLLARKQAIEDIGLMNESYFMYAEDMDWCLRAKLKGWKVIYFPKLEVMHHSGKSMAQFKKERFWRGLFSISSFYARTKSKGIGFVLFNTITAFGYFLRAALFFIQTLFCWQAKTWQSACQSFEFFKASLAILFGLNFLYRTR